MRIFLSLLALLFLVPSLALAAPQDEEAPTKDDVAKQFMDGCKKKLDELDEASARLTSEKLVEIFQDEEISEGIREDVPDFLEDIATGDVEASRVYGIQALGTIGGDDAAKSVIKVLQKALKSKEPQVAVYTACLKALGSIASEDSKVVKELTSFKYKEFDVIGKAASALAGYEKASGKLRNDLMKEVLNASSGIYNQANANDNEAKRRWNIIRGGVMSALNALSGQSFTDPAQARSWYNDHKKDRDVWK